MSESNSVAVIGDWASVMGFRALGLDAYPAASAAEAAETLRKLAEAGCAVIYLTETLAKDMENTLAGCKDMLRPAVILIPGREGSLGIGKTDIQQAIQRAIGTGIL